MAAASFVLVYSSPNRLLYQVTTDGTGTAGTLTSTGAASPDLLTDSKIGPIKTCALAFTNGFGTLAAGALSQSNSRAIWLSVNASVITAPTLATARCRMFSQTALTVWQVDANVDGSGHATVVCTPSAVTGIGLLEVEAPGIIGE